MPAQKSAQKSAQKTVKKTDAEPKAPHNDLYKNETANTEHKPEEGKQLPAPAPQPPQDEPRRPAKKG